MNRKLWRKAMIAALAGTMAASMTGCGGDSENSSANAQQKYFKAEYLSDLPETFNNTTNNISFEGDMMYYGSYDENYENYKVYSYNMVSKENKTLYENPESDSVMGNSWIYTYTVSDAGEIYLSVGKSEPDLTTVTEDYSSATLEDVYQYMQEEWDYSEDMAHTEWDDFYAEKYTLEDGTVDYGSFLVAEKATYIQTASIVKADASGTVLSEQVINTDSDMSVSCNGMAVDNNGNICVLLNQWGTNNDSVYLDEYYIMVFDADGNEKGEIKLESGYANGLIQLADGTIATVGYGEENFEVCPLDTNSMKENKDKAVAVPSDMVFPLDETHFLITEGTTVYKYDINTKEKEEYLSWLDCNIASSSVDTFAVLSDGRIAAYIQNWYSSDNQNEIALIKEVDADEAANTVRLTLASLWTGSDLEEKVIAFNKSQDEYHISIKSFADGDMDYEDAVNSFTTAVTSNSGIDLVLFENYSQAVNFASKGLNIDLYELIESDADLSKDDFLPNILQACEYDGKLAFLPQGFSLQTVIGKADDVGTEPGWTLEEMKELLASKPEGTQLFQGMDRATALSALMNLGCNDFINWEDASCNFDSEEFIDVLEFAAMFPEEFEWTEDMEDSSVLMNQGKVLLDTYYLNDFEQVQIYRTVFGGDTTFIGYPNAAQSNGAMLGLNNIVGISNNCKDKDGAWKFVRTLFLPTDNKEEGSYGFSARKDDFEAFCENATKEKDYSHSWGWGNFEIEVQPATQKDVDQVKELVYNTTAVNGAVSEDITNIINEEAAAYFSGQKSAQDVADIIQSRMQVYLSETK